MWWERVVPGRGAGTPWPAAHTCPLERLVQQGASRPIEGRKLLAGSRWQRLSLPQRCPALGCLARLAPERGTCHGCLARPSPTPSSEPCPTHQQGTRRYMRQQGILWAAMPTRGGGGAASSTPPRCARAQTLHEPPGVTRQERLSVSRAPAALEIGSTMVKVGSNLCEKPGKEQGAGGDSDDSFDNIPLITPLDVSQLQQPFPDKVIVKTRTEYQLQQQQKRKLHVPGVKKLNINLYDEVSEKVKLTGLILITMAFLACLLMLVMYKALWYDQLSCPEGFVFKHKHCTPAALEMYYSEQEAGPPGSLYTAISHLNPGKKILPEMPSPWVPVINALKEAEKGKEDRSGVQQ